MTDLSANDAIVDLAKRLRTLGVREFSNGQVAFKIDLTYKDRIRSKKEGEQGLVQTVPAIFTTQSPTQFPLHSLREPLQAQDNRTPSEKQFDDTLYYSAS